MVSEAKRFQLALPARPPAVAVDRLATMFHHHYDFVWRTVRNFGVSDANAEDAARHDRGCRQDGRAAENQRLP